MKSKNGWPKPPTFNIVSRSHTLSAQGLIAFSISARAAWLQQTAFDRLIYFGRDDVITKHCYSIFGSRPPGVDGIKPFDKDDQATKNIAQEDIHFK